MIEKLTLNNFQSHEKTEVSFSPGMNVIIGSSNSGKSALLRSLYWNITNRPSGTAMVSHWCVDEKGNQKEDTSATLQVSGREVKRVRGKGMNAYLIDGGALEAIGTELPAEVSALLNIGDVNIQKQMDAPFLLSESSGEVARFFNKTIKLDLIDKMLSLVEKDKREIRAKKEVTAGDLIDMEKSLETFAWIAPARLLLDKAEKAKARADRSAEKSTQLSKLISSDENASIKIEEIGSWLSRASTIMDKINVQNSTIINKHSRIMEIQKMIANDQQSTKTLDSLTYLNKAAMLLIAFSALRKDSVEVKARGQGLASLLNRLGETEETLSSALKNVERLTAQLPSACPLCGSPMKGKAI